MDPLITESVSLLNFIIVLLFSGRFCASCISSVEIVLKSQSINSEPLLTKKENIKIIRRNEKARRRNAKDEI